MLLGALGAGVARGQSTLTTLTENQDGKVQDIAAQTDAGDSQSTRMWLAQGRVRAAFRLGDRVRMFAEDQSFPPGAAAQDRELLVAIEVEETLHHLVTLTDRALYFQSIGGTYSPGNPGPAHRLDLASYLLPPPTPLPLHDDAVTDLKVRPINGLLQVFLLTEKRLLVFRHYPADPVFLGAADELRNQGYYGFLTGTTAMANFKVTFLRRLRMTTG
jgi:hypothetical protein